jgi:nucleotide-binding universal stress UspA family protein
MNSLGSILVHVDALPRSQVRLQLASTLAAHAGTTQAPCRIHALYGATPFDLYQPFAYADSAASSLVALRELDELRRREARARFDRVCAGAGAAMHWVELNNENAITGTAEHALLADLVLFGRCYGHSRAREWVLGEASRTLLRSMTLPVLLAH